MDYKKLFEEVYMLTIKTGDYISAEVNKLTNEHIEVKGLHNFVTYVDKQSEERLVKGLKAILPGSGFIVEENSVTYMGEDFKWIIDPLDGTTNFIHSIPCFAISIALMKGSDVKLGIIYEISRKECFYSFEGSQSFMNGDVISVSASTNLSDTLIATGFPYYDYGKMNEYIDVLKHFMKTTHGVRRLGSAAVDLAYVACGRFDAFYEYGLSPWDVAAGAFIVKQAGGRVSDFNGGDNYIFGKEIIAANNNIYLETFNTINNFFI